MLNPIVCADSGSPWCGIQGQIQDRSHDDVDST